MSKPDYHRMKTPAGREIVLSNIERNPKDPGCYGTFFDAFGTAHAFFVNGDHGNYVFVEGWRRDVSNYHVHRSYCPNEWPVSEAILQQVDDYLDSIGVSRPIPELDLSVRDEPVGTGYNVAGTTVDYQTACTYGAIIDERRRQDAKWGKQQHPPARWLAILTEEVGEVAKEIVDALAALDEAPGSERYYEHLAKAQMEMVQVAAVSVAFIQDLDRLLLRGQAAPTGPETEKLPPPKAMTGEEIAARLASLTTKVPNGPLPVPYINTEGFRRPNPAVIVEDADELS